MKATGIVRRIDDLGRIVIPKEIRKTLRIRESDPLEIFTDREGEVILKKYSPLGELSQFADSFAEALAQTLGSLVCITDRDHVVAASGNGRKEYDGKPISKQLEEMMEERKNVSSSRKDRQFMKITMDDPGLYEFQSAATVISEGDVVGSIVQLSGSKIDENPNLIQAAARFLGRQMES